MNSVIAAFEHAQDRDRALRAMFAAAGY